MFISNTAARDLINDRIQVANVTTLLAGKEDAGEGIAFAIALNIKRRCLERTQFYTKPVTEQLKKLPDDLLRGFAKDMDKLISRIPKKMVVVKEKMTT